MAVAKAEAKAEATASAIDEVIEQVSSTKVATVKRRVTTSEPAMLNHQVAHKQRLNRVLRLPKSASSSMDSSTSRN